MWAKTEDNCQEARPQMLLRITVLQFLYAFGIKKGTKENYLPVGESKEGMGLQSS